MKNIIIRTMMSLMAFAAIFTTQAQQPTGSWQRLDLYSGVPKRVVESTSGPTYIFTLGRLYGYDAENEEFIDYYTKLNGPTIKFVEYDPIGKVLCVVYENANMDLIHDNGKVVNLPDIKDAIIDYTKDINSVSFYGKSMYVSTSFGLVEYDTERGVVKQSGVWGKNVQGAGVVGDRLMIVIDSMIRSMPLSNPINRLSSFTESENNIQQLEFMASIPGSNLLAAKYNNGIRIYAPDADGMPEVKTIHSFKDVAYFMPANDGLYVVSSNKLYKIRQDGYTDNSVDIPSAIRGQVYGTNKGASLLWAGDGTGVAAYDISGSTPVMKVDRVGPHDAMSVQRVVYITPSSDGSLFFSNLGPNRYNPGADSGEGTAVTFYCDRLDNGEITNVRPTPDVKAPCGIAISPEDPSIYYLASRMGYLLEIKDGKEIGRINTSNFPTVKNLRFFGVSIDKQGNLWVSNMDTDNTTARRIHMLPAAKRIAGLANVVTADWISYQPFGWTNNLASQMLVCEHSPMIFIASGAANSGMSVVHTNNTWDNPNDDIVRAVTVVYDTEGNKTSGGYWGKFAEDQDGKVWVAWSGGVFVIDNPTEAITDQFRWRRPKVPRGDGTNYADYLLSGVAITGISVDGMNRKWIATKDAGVYLVNPDGTEILEHFTSDNSMLASNEINTVYADPASNLVYIATNQGVYTYASNTTQGSPDYSNVYAYPNPVRPDYSGWITITGLMNSSLVKICDASGAVVAQGHSDGGMFVWDGCNTAGARVKSGIYYVMASQNANGNNEGVVTKILIMN